MLLSKRLLLSATILFSATVFFATSHLAASTPNLVKDAKATASSEQDGNWARHAFDGKTNTRWCASGPRPNEWLQVELKQPSHVRTLRVQWERRDAYAYKIDASPDGAQWTTIVDQSKNQKTRRVQKHKVDAASTKFLRLTFLGSKRSSWGSLWELEAYEGAAPKLQLADAAGNGKESEGTNVTLGDVKVPEEFEVTLFGVPPEVNYPVCLTCAPNGDVYIGVDEQGSLGKQKDRGKVIRCVDTDGDGKADKVTTFAKMNHPRGLVYDNGNLWVLHPPYLTLYKDTDLDGVADEQKTLIKGISTDQVGKRGADHTTNGIRMGIDGWIYIAVGDFGFVNAVGADETTLSRRGGGIVRIQPDGSEMEIFCWGLRNILDVSIDPYMNVFTRDNTNDGGGWDIRLSHILQSAEYGYPSLYKNFHDEIMPPLADYGGGSGCGSMYFHDLRWPAPFADAVYTCDWGTSDVFRHNLPYNGATFDAHQETFIKIPRPTDIDVDARGLMYVSSWKNGKFSYSGPDVGFVAQVRPKGYKPEPFVELSKAPINQLVDLLKSPSAVHRFHSQREILRREAKPATSAKLIAIAGDDSEPLYVRAAAIFTLKQWLGTDSHDALIPLSTDNKVGEFALRALADRKSQLDGLSPAPFLAALDRKDNRRLQAQAIISIARLGDPKVAKAVLPLTKRQKSTSDSKKPWAEPDPNRVIPHLAVRTLDALDAVDECLAALDGENSDGALWALKYMHSVSAVDGLTKALTTVRNDETRKEIITTLIRLYHQEGPYEKGWWGTRPDTSGPYYDRQPWEGSEKIASVIRSGYPSWPAEIRDHVVKQLKRHKVEIEKLSTENEVAAEEKQIAVVVPKVDPNNPNLVANLSFEESMRRATDHAGDAAVGQKLFKTQSCVACHTVTNGQTPKGPHLVDIGKRYKRHELAESVLKPGARIAQGFDTYSFITERGKTIQGFIVTESAKEIQIRQTDGSAMTLKSDEIEERIKLTTSLMPQGLANNITPEQLGDLLAYLESLK